ncbi:MAG: hypothetical protein ACI9SE_001610, partial [Neolewinella sp.]
ATRIKQPEDGEAEAEHHDWGEHPSHGWFVRVR